MARSSAQLSAKHRRACRGRREFCKRADRSDGGHDRFPRVAPSEPAELSRAFFRQPSGRAPGWPARHSLRASLAPLPFNTPNLASSLIAAGLTFATYSENLPSVGFDGDSYSTDPAKSQYQRKHNPVANWQAADAPANYHVPFTVNQPFTSFPTDPAGYATLPTVSIVVPDQQNDMHDGSIAQGDAWLKAQILDGYYQWAKTHNSLLIVTFDEDAGNAISNQIVTIFAGAMIKPGNYFETNINPPDTRPPDGGVITPTGTAMTHYNVLRTLEEMYGLPPIGGSANTPPITDVWRVSDSVLLNSSTRVRTGSGDDVSIGGFIIAGAAKKRSSFAASGLRSRLAELRLPGRCKIP